ncbi:MAG: hypothetical protein J6S21_06760, partial [Victivallales bacterium]|nr:hypothetical protein [Victivallales bacterium]
MFFPLMGGTGICRLPSFLDRTEISQFPARIPVYPKARLHRYNGSCRRIQMLRQTKGEAMGCIVFLHPKRSHSAVLFIHYIIRDVDRNSDSRKIVFLDHIS